MKKVVKTVTKKKGHEPKISKQIVPDEPEQEFAVPKGKPKPYPLEDQEPIVEEATDADVRETKKETKVAPALPVPAENERLFECPQGHVIVGRLTADNIWCSDCQVKANPKR